MMAIERLNRYQAFAIHLLLSLVFFLIVLVLITGFWYPGFLFSSAGGDKAVQLIIGIDLILGPLLTLIVFNTAKASLKKDLLIILAIQLAALTAGSFTIWHSRPVAVIYHHPEFTTIYANNPVVSKISPLLQQSDNNPPMLYYRDPTGGFDTQYQQGEFVLYSSAREEIKPLITRIGRATDHNTSISVSLDKARNSNTRLLINTQDLSVINVSGTE